MTCYGACDKTWFYDNVRGKENEEEMEELDFEEVMETLKQIDQLPFRGSRIRNIEKPVYEFYGVRSEIQANGEPGSRYYPWHVDGKHVSYKQKTLEKKYYMKGDTQSMNRKGAMLWGQHLFAGGGRTLVITEGEDDACAIQMAYSKKYNGKRFPVVSLFNTNNPALVINNLEWINSFEKVILWPDVDQHGKGEQVMDDMAKAIGPKAHIVDCKNYKDANDAWIGEGTEFVISKVWNAQPFTPAGFIKGKELWERFKERKNVKALPYPDCLAGLNTKLKGMRKGEITLFVSGTGSGKSTTTKEVMLEIMAKSNEKLGIICLEEDVGETTQKFIEMKLGKDVMDEDNPVPEEDQYAAYKELFGDENVIVLDHQGSVGDESLIEKMRALCAMGVGYIVLDHITIAVSEGNEGLTGNEATDKMMSDLLKLVKAWPVWLGLISHLRKTGAGGNSFEEGHMASLDDIKGSGSIKQISFDIIAFARNMVHEDERERNTTRFRVLKARFTGKTGDAGAATYNHETRRMSRVAINSTESAVDMFDKLDPEDELRKDIGL